MNIFFSLKDNSFNAHSIEELHDKVKQYFTSTGFSPDVTIEDERIHVQFSNDDIADANRKLDLARSLCDNRKFKKAKLLLNESIKSNPYISEAHRLLAQIAHQEGDVEKAIDICIEALRCDPKNVYALLLMANIYNADKKDHELAIKYFNTVLEIQPDNYIASNNLAAIYANQGDTEKARNLFKQVIELDKTYENAYFGLAQIYYDENKFEKAFECARQGCVNGIRRPENPKVSEMLRKLMVASAHAITEVYDYKNVFLAIKDMLEELDHNEIREISDSSLKEYAKMEYGPIHGHSYHTIKYNPKRPFIYHLLVHELTHLDLILEAHRNGASGKFVSINSDNEGKFRSRFSAWNKNLINKIGYTKANEIVGHVQAALNLQLMNCPLDLFVENRIFSKYEVMRPLQLLSLIAQEEDNIHAVVESAKSRFIPQPILRANKIMNIVTSFNLESLYGIRLYNSYNPTKDEFDTAKDLYEEYKDYSDYKPGEEYELISYFAETLNLQDFYSLVSEYDINPAKKEPTNEEDGSLTDDLDEFKRYEGNSVNGLTDEQEKSQDNFYKQNKDGDDEAITMMMTSYMIGALQIFDGKSLSFIKSVAFEIATIGINGINPKNEYVVKSLDNKKMSGYETLAFYYVSWKLFNPELHKTLQLPFDTAWLNAEKLFNSLKGDKE